MSKTLRFILPFVSVFILSATFALGQSTTGSIQGTVKDTKGAIVPGAAVTVTGQTAGFKQTTVSNSDGVYRFDNVPPGKYRVTVAAISGFSETSADVQVVIEKTTPADVTLGIGASVNTVEVAADPLGVVVDTSDSKVQTNITSRLIDDLPKGTNITTVLKAAPAVRQEPLSGGFQVDGASGSENTFLIDGQALENFRTGVLNINNNIPTTLVQEVQVKVGGFEAEHGGASGAVVSIATKGGTDQWRGEFGTQFETSGLQAGPRFAPSFEFDPSGDKTQRLYGVRPLKDHYTNYFPTASLGGPILKKRIWFYGNYSPQIFPLTRTVNYFQSVDDTSFSGSTVNEAPAGVASPGLHLVRNTTTPTQTYKATTRNEYAFARIDAQIFSKLRYSGTFLWNPTIDEGQIPYGTIAVGGTPRDPADYRLRGGRTNSNNFTSQLSYTPTSKLVATARYARAFLNEKDGNYNIAGGPWSRCGGDPSVYTGAEGCPYGFNSGATPNVLRDVSLKNELNVDVSYILNHFAGSHILKGGYQYGTVKNDVAGSSFSDPYYGRSSVYYGENFDYLGYDNYNSLCNLYDAVTNPTGDCLGVGSLLRYGTSGIGKNRYQAIYVQDKWQPTQTLTLNLGIRFENENLPAFNTGSGRGGVPLKFGWGKKVAPRLGFSWDPFGSGKTRVFGSYGLFYDRLKFELPRGSFGGDFYRYDIFPILASHPEYSYYLTPNILGNWNDPIGGGDPSTTGGLSVLEVDYRIPSNITQEQATELGLPFTGVDPNLKPFRQSELTFGFERELNPSYVLSARYTRKNVDSAIEDHGILGDNYSENYIIGNPGQGFDLQLDQASGYAKSLKPQRLYNGLEIVLNKRLSHHYYYNLNYTLSRLYGNYSGLASSDENGRTSPGVNRFFDYIVNGFTFTGNPDNGDLPTDRRHAFKAYGGYEYDWFGSKTNSTEISFFQQILQGTPLTTFIGIQNSDMVFSRRGDLGRSPTFWQTDLSISHRYKFGKDGRFTFAFDFNVLNLFNNDTVLLVQSDDVRYARTNTVSFAAIDPTYNSTGNAAGPFNMILNGQFTPAQVDAYLSTRSNNPLSILYGQPRSYQAPRNIRFGFRFYF